MRYEIELYTWYSVDMWAREFTNHDEMFKWYKEVKHDIENDQYRKDYVYKVKVKCWTV